MAKLSPSCLLVLIRVWDSTCSAEDWVYLGKALFIFDRDA